jgi:hypothetical protein
VCEAGKRYLRHLDRLGKDGLLGAGGKALWGRWGALGLWCDGHSAGKAGWVLDGAYPCRSARARVCPILLGRRRVMSGECEVGEVETIEGGRLVFWAGSKRR